MPAACARAIAFLQRCGCRALGAQLADVLLVLGDIGEMRKIAEGANDAHGIVERHAVQDAFELAACRLVVVAMETHRRRADPFDQVEDRATFLIAHRVAKHPAQQPDIGAQPCIRLDRRGLRTRRLPGQGFGTWCDQD